MDNQETNPTPEQWQQQQQNRNYQQSPYNQPFSMPEEYQQQPRGSKFGGGMGAIFIAVALSLVLCYAMISFLGITPSMKQYKADITRLEMDLVDIRTVNDGQATNIGNLAGAVATANSAATKAQSALDLSNSIKTGYDTIRADVTALQAALEDIDTNGTGDVYDDAEIRGLITALQGNITTINADITALQAYDTTNTANLVELRNAIDDLEDEIDDIDTGTVDLTGLQNQIDIINHFINDADTVVGSLKYKLKQLEEIISANDNALQNQIDKINAIRTARTFYPSTASSNAQMSINTVAGDYAIIITLYGSNLMDLTLSDIQIFSELPLTKTVAYYGQGNGTMVMIILEPTDTITGTIVTENNWLDNKVVTLLFATSMVSESNIQYVTIDTAIR